MITQNNLAWLGISLLLLVLPACGAAESADSEDTALTVEVTHTEGGEEHTHVVGTDLLRDEEGTFLVLEDNGIANGSWAF